MEDTRIQSYVKYLIKNALLNLDEISGLICVIPRHNFSTFDLSYDAFIINIHLIRVLVLNIFSRSRSRILYVCVLIDYQADTVHYLDFFYVADNKKRRAKTTD